MDKKVSCVGDIVKYENGYGIFEGKVIEVQNDMLVVDSDGEIFGLSPSGVVED